MSEKNLDIVIKVDVNKDLQINLTKILDRLVLIRGLMPKDCLGDFDIHYRAILDSMGDLLDYEALKKYKGIAIYKN